MLVVLLVFLWVWVVLLVKCFLLGEIDVVVLDKVVVVLLGVVGVLFGLSFVVL